MLNLRWFHIVEKSYTKIKKIKAKNITRAISVKVWLSTVGHIKKNLKIYRSLP